jgi:RND family efflux transporter MFP subunit
MKKKIIGITLIAATLYGCSGGKKAEQTGATTATAAVDIKSETVHRRRVEQIREYTGTISPYSKNMIASQSAMRIDKLLVEIGDHVRVGQVLVQMEETNYLQSKLQLENLKTDYQRAQQLYATGGVSKQQIDQLKTQLEVADEAYRNLEKNTRLLSPINGVITKRNFDNGDVTGGQPIFEVQQLQPVKITVNVQEEFFAHVTKNMTAKVTLDIYPNDEFTGRVNLVYPTIDNMTHTFTTEIVLPNSNMKVRPGMFARVVLNFGVIERVVAPDKAVVKQPGTDERFVYVVNADSTVTHRTVTLGLRLDNAYEVLTGLDDGEKVVTAGVSKLINGAAIREVKGL